MDFDVDEVVQAELWEMKLAGKKFGPGLERKIRQRLAEGMGERDRASLEAYRRHRQREQERFQLPELPELPAGERYERQRAEVRAALGQRQKITPEQGHGA